MIGQTISHYRITEKLGEGGMGVVYKAVDTTLNRTVALKFLSPQLVDDPLARARLVQEARAAAALHHSGICTIHDIEEEAGHTFICMAYVKGESLLDRIAAGPLDLDAVITIFRQVAAALDAAHTQGVVHRDIKSANVMITPEGRAVIMDFGLAKTSDATRMTQAGTMLGTLAYMSPEQVRGEQVDARSDIWSLGVMLYEMLTGQLPFGNEVHHAVIHAILNNQPRPLATLRPELPYRLEEILAKALAKNPGHRYQRVADLLSDLDRLASHSDREHWVGVRRFMRRRGMKRIGWALPLVVIGFATLLRFYPRDSGIDSLAVLPFADRSPDSAQVYLADGMTDALIGELGRIGALRVVSWTSVRQFKETTKSVPQIARELGVDALVEASVARRGDDIQISAKLIRAVPEEQVWNATFATDVRDVLTLYRNVARTIADQISVELTQQEEARLAEVRDIDPRAYDAFLRGKQLLYSMMSFRHLTQAIAHFDEAIAWEPNYALAWASKAYVHSRICQWWGGSLRTAHCSTARQAALRALDLDDQLAESHVAMARIHLVNDMDFTAARHSIRQAVDLNPHNAWVLREWGQFESRAGAYENAMRAYDSALRLDPRNDDLLLQKGFVYWVSGRFAEGIQHFQHMLEQFPDHRWALQELAWCYGDLGMVAQADSIGRILGGGTPEWTLRDQARQGRWELVLAEIESLRDTTGTIVARQQSYSDHSFLAIAASFAALEETESAYAWLDLTLQEAPHQLVDLLGHFEFDPLRREARFADFMQRAGFSSEIIERSRTLDRWSPRVGR